MGWRRLGWVGVVLAAAGASLPAATALADITGVQPAALDQPRVSIQLRRKTNGPVLSAKVDGEQTSEIEAFADTGASGVLLSANTAGQLGIRSTPNVTYEDVGIGGSDQFGVSEPLLASIKGDLRSSRPIAIRTQISTKVNVIEALVGDLDIAGMPIIAGHILAIDPKPVEKIQDKLRVSFLDAPAAARLKMTWHIKLTPVSFRRFTRLTPGSAIGPTVVDNPMIGPNPFSNDHSPGVVIALGNHSAEGTFLLDTGSACSVISKRQAAMLGIRYAQGSDDRLADVPENKQFHLTVGGIGGQHAAAGFYLDSLTVPTKDKTPLVFRHAPVLVSDISVVDPATKETFTVDGVFGMNYLVPSANIVGGMNIGEISSAPFSLIVLDLKQYLLEMK